VDGYSVEPRRSLGREYDQANGASSADAQHESLFTPRTASA